MTPSDHFSVQRSTFNVQPRRSRPSGPTPVGVQRSSPASAAAAPLRPPAARIHALATRALAAFPECGLSWSLIRDWALEQLGLQKKWSTDIAAIDDELERCAPDLWQSLQNDPPALRRRVWTAWQKTQANTNQTAAEVART